LIGGRHKTSAFRRGMSNRLGLPERTLPRKVPFRITSTWSGHLRADSPA
jgi:hypothetical protein